MALRLDAQADTLQRTANLPASSTAVTLCGWFRRRGSGGTNELLVAIAESPGGPAIVAYIGLGGTPAFTLFTPAHGAPVTGGSITTDTWYFLALSGQGTGATDAKLRHAALGATSLTTISATNASFTPGLVQFGFDDAGQWPNAALAGWKLYDRVLTDAELLAEMNRLRPASTTNLNAWWPMVADVAATADNDFSGNARDLTPAGTITVEDGPPVGWGAPILVVGAAASGSTGTLAATESGADTAALAGDVLIDGSLAATESGGDTAALAGDVLIAGTFAATESGADVAAIQGTAQQVSTGSLAATESGADTASIAGTVLVEGALAATESGSDTAAIAGDVPVSGTLAATESGTDTAALAGDVYISGALAATESGSDTAAIEGSLAVIATGSLAATESGSDTASIAGVVLVSGSLAATEAANDSAAMSGVVLITGTLDATESGQDTAAISSAPPVTTAYPGPAGKSRGKRRRVVIRERVYEVSERDIPALIEAELLDRAPPVTAEVVAGPKPPRKRRKSATQPVKTVEQVREVVQQIKARIEPDNAWLVQALETVAFRVLERLQDEEDSLMLLLAA